MNKVSYGVTWMTVLAAAASTSQALTLGDLQGRAVIGRPLEVSVQVSPGAGEELAASCLSADIVSGDAQRLGASLAVSALSSGLVPVSTVRIRSTAAVAEPVVTVVLRTTCGGLTSRQYVLLADFPASDLPRVAGASVTRPIPAQVPNVLTVWPQTAASSAKPMAESTASASVSGRASGRADVVTGVPKPVVAAKKRPDAPLAVKPESPPAPPEPDLPTPVLKLDATAMLPALAQPPASAALPALLAASALAGEAAQQAQRVQALQGDFRALQDLAMTNEAALATLQVKLHQAETERLPVTWLYLLGGLLVAALAGLAWVLRRQRKNDPSETWAVAPAHLPPVATLSDFGETFERIAPAAPASEPIKARSLFQTDASRDIDLDIDLGSLAPTDTEPTASQPLAVEPADGFATVHNLNGDAVTDVRQQAEFFVSLGQTQRAMTVLQKNVRESP